MINKYLWLSGKINTIKSLLITSPALAVASFCIYLKTTAPGVWGFDSAELASGVYSLGIIHPPGYPLYILIGKIFISIIPIGDVAYKLNILSALFASATVLILFEIIYRITHHKLIAWSTAAFFSVSNYFWQMALVAEVYTLHTFLLSLLLFLVLSQQKTYRVWKLYAISFIFGLSLCNHTSGILFSFGFSWLLFINPKLRSEKLLNFLIMGGLFLLGLLPYIYMPIRASSNPILNYANEYSGINLTTIQGVWWMVSGQAYRFFAFGYAWPEIPTEISRFLGYLWRNYLGVGVIIGLSGIYYLWRINWKQMLGWLLIFASNVIFFINYRVMDKDTMFLPAFLIWAIFLGGGLKYIVCLSRRINWPRSLSLRQPTLTVLLIALPLLPLSLNWKWVDLSSIYGSSSFSRYIFENTAPNSLIIGEWSSSVILEYYQIVEGKRPDLIIYNRPRSQTARFYEEWTQGSPYQESIDKIFENEIEIACSEMLKRKVYMIEYDPAFETHFEFLPIGDFFELKPKANQCPNR